MIHICKEELLFPEGDRPQSGLHSNHRADGQGPVGEKVLKLKRFKKWKDSEKKECDTKSSWYDLSYGHCFSYSWKSEQKHLVHSHFQEFPDTVIPAVLWGSFEKHIFTQPQSSEAALDEQERR